MKCIDVFASVQTAETTFYFKTEIREKKCLISVVPGLYLMCRSCGNQRRFRFCLRASSCHQGTGVFESLSEMGSCSLDNSFDNTVLSQVKLTKYFMIKSLFMSYL